MAYIESIWKNPFKELGYCYRCPYCGKLLYWEENSDLGWAEWRVSTNEAFIRYRLSESPSPLETHICGLCAEILKGRFEYKILRGEVTRLCIIPFNSLSIAANSWFLGAAHAICVERWQSPYRTTHEGETASFYKSAKETFEYAAKTNARWLIRRYLEKATKDALQKSQKDPAAFLAEIFSYLQANMQLEMVLQTDWGKRTIGEVHSLWKSQTEYPVLFYPYATLYNPYHESLPHLHEDTYFFDDFEENVVPILSPYFYPDVFYPLVPTEEECWNVAASEAVHTATEGPDSYLARRIVRELYQR